MATVIFIIVFFGLIFVFSSMETKENSENKKKEEDVVVYNTPQNLDNNKGAIKRVSLQKI